jgi:hypothetical protein
VPACWQLPFVCAIPACCCLRMSCCVVNCMCSCSNWHARGVPLN